MDRQAGYDAPMDGRVLLISVDSHVQEQVQKACAQLNLTAVIACGDEEISQAIAARSPDVVLLDVHQPGAVTMTTFPEFRRRWPRLCTILLAEHARSNQAIDAMKHGAIDYLLKPLQDNELVNHLAAARRISRDMNVPTVYEKDELERPADHIIGQSPGMHEVFKLIGLLAARDVNVLITGESGTGKELVAKALYQHSRRKDQPFLAVNCAAIPETLLESELFGHEKGAFTGADIRRIGKFEQCDGGTLFLDEIGDLPLATQAKLLRVLQDGSFQRLGSAETVRSDVRILAATNQPLETLIAERRFRQDLYYRLKVTSIDLPPLRDREVDVVLLAHHFVRRFNPQFGTNIQRFAPEVLPALLSYPWPGNVRELENVIKASLVVSRGNVFLLDFLPESIRTAAPSAPLPTAPPPVVEEDRSQSEPLRRACRRLLAHKPYHGEIHRRIIELAEREVIQACLEETSGQLAPAARLLGITRTTLRKKMAALGIQVRTSVSHD